jgi:hypothetical protein
MDSSYELPFLLKSFVLYNITPCNTVKVNLCFRRTYRLHHQSKWISQAINQHKASSKQADSLHTLLPASFLLLAWRNLRPWRWRRYVPPKQWVDFHWTTRRYILEDRTLYNYRCENLKSYIPFLLTSKPEPFQFLQWGLREGLWRKQSCKGRLLNNVKELKQASMLRHKTKTFIMWLEQWGIYNHQ